jgi:beta-glucosidase
MIYKDSAQSIENRVKDLLECMTLEEKVAQLCCILPNMLIGKKTPDPKLLNQHMHNGLGRITQFSMFFWNSPVEIAKFANAIQKWVAENTRLGIPLLFQNEVLNGFLAVGATNFPTPINMASAWRPDLVGEAATIIREEMRAVGVRKGLAPVVDLSQDPRWGRVYETYGEDPYLNAVNGTAFAHGLQTDNLQNGVISCAKHFLGYSISQGGINQAAIHIGQRDLYEKFAYPFEAMIHEAGLRSVMCTYSEIDGIPVSVNRAILRDLLRDKMGFQGSAICDGSSIELCVEQQHVCRDMKEAAIMALEAGLDADTPVTVAFHHLVEAVQEGLVKMAVLDEAVSRVLTGKFELGLFENPYVDEGKVLDVFSSPSGKRISRQIADESIILLKNENDLLPLGRAMRSIAVIGPHADSLRSLFAGYSMPASLEMLKGFVKGMAGKKKDKEEKATMAGVTDALKKTNTPDGKKKPQDIGQIMGLFTKVGKILLKDMDTFIQNSYHSVSLKAIIEEYVSDETKVVYEKGCSVVDESKKGFNKAVRAAKRSEVVILALGDKSGWKDSTSGEGQDRSDLNLPGVQEELLKAIVKTGKPVVLILLNGRPLTIPWAAEHVPAILETWIPGQEGARAIGSVLFGEVNPSGKLPVTLPRSVGQVPIYYNHKMGSSYSKTNMGFFEHKGYNNEPSTPLYPFGFGLSYTKFAYHDLQITPHDPTTDGEVAITCTIENTGSRYGDEVVQLYLHDCEAHVTRPVKELKGFQKVSLKPGQSCKVTFIVPVSLLGFYNETMQFVVEPGKIDVLIGSSSEDIRLAGMFTLCGPTQNVMGKRAYLSKAKVEYDPSA